LTESKRKEAQRKASRAARRSGVLPRQKQAEEAASQAPRKTDPNSPQAKKGAEPQLDDSGKVSSLLETTGEEVKQLLEAADDAAEKIREAAKAEESGAGGEKPAEGNEALSLISSTNKEVQEVLEAAEDAAEKIREEARAEARRLIEESRRRVEGVTNEQMDRVSEMTEQVLGELSAVQDHLETLRNAFDQSLQTMNADLGGDQTAVWDSRNGALEGDEESAELRARLGRRRKTVPAKEPEGISEGARLLALQQLMAGVDAEVIEHRLRNEFGIKDPKPILEWMGIRAETHEKPQKR
jgi:vacuolar-type H+-ATPase subunit H